MKIADTLSAALERLLRPEKFHHDGSPYRRGISYAKPRAALEPRDRLSVRLAMLVEIKEWEIALMKEIVADTESIIDAKIAMKAQGEV